MITSIIKFNLNLIEMLSFTVVIVLNSYEKNKNKNKKYEDI